MVAVSSAPVRGKHVDGQEDNQKANQLILQL